MKAADGGRPTACSEVARSWVAHAQLIKGAAFEAAKENIIKRYLVFVRHTARVPACGCRYPGM
jgi:hypothetical protein